MRGTIAVLLALDGKVQSGSLELLADRLEFRGRDRTLTIPLDRIERFGIERDVLARINGLAVLKLSLEGAVVVRVASLQGVGVLHQLADRLAPAGDVFSGI